VSCHEGANHKTCIDVLHDFPHAFAVDVLYCANAGAHWIHSLDELVEIAMKRQQMNTRPMSNVITVTIGLDEPEDFTTSAAQGETLTHDSDIPCNDSGQCFFAFVETHSRCHTMRGATERIWPIHGDLA
jgi:hypothetical protein